jgi:hypothetical protein
MLKKVEHLRSLYKTELAKQGVLKHWVMNGWEDVIGVTGQSREENILS